MKNEINALKKNEKEPWLQGGEGQVVKSENSQKETLKECRLELSMSDYRELAKRAMKEGCTPEELVARRLAQLLR